MGESFPSNLFARWRIDVTNIRFSGDLTWIHSKKIFRQPVKLVHNHCSLFPLLYQPFHLIITYEFLSLLIVYTSIPSYEERDSISECSLYKECFSSFSSTVYDNGWLQLGYSSFIGVPSYYNHVTFTREHARSEATEDSDTDLMVVIKGEIKPRGRLTR